MCVVWCGVMWCDMVWWGVVWYSIPLTFIPLILISHLIAPLRLPCTATPSSFPMYLHTFLRSWFCLSPLYSSSTDDVASPSTNPHTPSSFLPLIPHPVLPHSSSFSPCPLHTLSSLLSLSYSSPPAITEDCYRAARRSQVEHESHILSHWRLLLRSMPSYCFPSVPLRTYIPSCCCSRKVSTRVRYFIWDLFISSKISKLIINLILIYNNAFISLSSLSSLPYLIHYMFSRILLIFLILIFNYYIPHFFY